MQQNAKRILSFALAGTVIAGANIPTANADCNKNNTVIEETMPTDLYYTVEEGDTLGGISVKYFGTPQYFEELAKYNKIENPDLIYQGQLIRIPYSLTDLLISTYPRPFEPDKIYVVQDDDYLFTIVEKFYGEENRNLTYVDKLATYNDLEDPNIIHVDQVLYIPEEAKLKLVEANDYSLQYKMLDWRINHPGEPYPFEVPEKECELVLKP